MRSLYGMPSRLASQAGELDHDGDVGRASSICPSHGDFRVRFPLPDFLVRARVGVLLHVHDDALLHQVQAPHALLKRLRSTVL